jgi:PKD repeat protein
LKFSSNGNIIWYRDYYYYPIDLFNDPEYEIKDLEIMPDGGFIMGGQVFNYDFFNDNVPFQFAYLLRTNCLGFLNPPEAALSYESDQGEVLFINNSMSAGSYTYYFGDGASLCTGEDIDSVMHTYENGGDYEVTLVAHGCNGEADTVKFNIYLVQEQEQETYGNIGDNYFTTFVELKTPNTELFVNSDSGKNRSGSWSLSNKLIYGVSQILEQKASGQIKLEKEPYNDKEEKITQKGYDSKCILVVGNLRNEIENSTDTTKIKEIKKKTFELYRRDSRNIEILTFDELYYRANYICNKG